jgi:hypothetical protein
MMLSGCQALKGCERKDHCWRHQRFLNSPHQGFHAYQTCRISEFTEKTYPHFVQYTPEAAMEELVRLSEQLGLYEGESV